MLEQPTDVFLSPGALRDTLSSVTVVDTRDPQEYRAGHIPGAINVPLDSFRDPSTVTPGMLPDPEEFAELLGSAGVTADDHVVAYDGDRGVNAARFLLTAAVCGHRGELSLLDGDITVWRRGRETTTNEPDSTPVCYDADPPEHPPIADRKAVEEATERAEAKLVDTRTEAEYDQAHIPGALQLGWEALVGPDRRLRPRAEIEAELEERGISRDDEILLYCNTARRLSHTYVVLRELGFEDVRFYEGSLTDWIRRESAGWDPVQLHEAVRQVAPKGFDGLSEELGEDIFSRLHLLGLYTQKQDDHFMLRTKVPAGRLTAAQAKTLGRIAEEFACAPPEHGGDEQNPIFGDGFLDVTTRQGIQMHWISPEDVPEIWDRYEAVGLTTLQASGNTLRNVVSCPTPDHSHADTTLDPDAIAEEIADAFEGERRYANLPRKLKVSVVGCRENCGRAEIQDLGFRPARKDGREGFHVTVGGGLSDGPRVGTDLGVFLEPDQVTPVTLAAAELFIDHGSYLDTAVNRLKFIVAEWGIDRFRSELESYLPFAFEDGGEDLTTGYRGDHVGVQPESDGTYRVGLCLPTGRIGGSEFARLGELAETYGDGRLRLTPNQNVVLTGVSSEDLERLRSTDLLDRYSPDPGPFSRGIVTCTGSEFCSYGVIETKSRGFRWARELDEWVEAELEDPPEVVRLHMSGCSASCAQPQIADIALRGETHRDESGTKPAVDIGLGGDLGAETFADWLTTEVPTERLPAIVRRLVTAADGDVSDFLDSASEERLYRIVTGRAETGPITKQAEGD